METMYPEESNQEDRAIDQAAGEDIDELIERQAEPPTREERIEALTDWRDKPAPQESEAYYLNMLDQLTSQLDHVSDEIDKLTSNKKDLALSLEDIRSEYIYHYPATMEALERKLKELDPEKEDEEYEGKRAGILAALEALSDSEYCKAHDC